MGSSLSWCAAIAALGMAAPSLAFADTYTMVDFTGQINGGNANVKAPFTGNGFAPNDPITGHFVYDNQLVPGSGLVNVFDNTFPDIANIPPGDAFSLTLDSLHFTAADNIDTLIPFGVQYSNGQFHGFEFAGDFQFQSLFYRFRIDGTVITVKQLDGVPNAFDPHGNPVPLTSSKINATINLQLANAQPYTPLPPNTGGGVPEPSAWALMLLGFGVVGGALRWERAARSLARRA
jgi:hypothetical protein